MSENTEDVRTKITPEEHKFLSAVALGSREEIASILRRLICQFLADKRHEYSVTAQILKGQGTVREPAGNREGMDP